MKYIDAERLRAEIDKRMTENCKLAEKCELVRTSEVFGNRASEDNDILAIIDSLQQELPIIEEDLVEKRKQECGYRRLLANGIYQCERYEGVFVPCDGRCSWIVDYPKLKELKKMKQPDADLEKEIENYYYDNFAFISSAHTPTKDIVSDIATHFYELGQRKAKEESK